MFVDAFLVFIATLAAVHLALAIKVLLPLARPQVDLPATMEAMAEMLRDAIQQEAKLSADRIRKQIERTPSDTPGLAAPVMEVGKPYRRP